MPADWHVNAMIVTGREVSSGEAPRGIARGLFFGAGQQRLHAVIPAFGLHDLARADSASLA